MLHFHTRRVLAYFSFFIRIFHTALAMIADDLRQRPGMIHLLVKISLTGKYLSAPPTTFSQDNLDLAEPILFESFVFVVIFTFYMSISSL